MRILIINLDREVERLEFQTMQMTRLGLEFERLSAVSVDRLPSDVGDGYWQTWERELSGGEKACFLSHRRAWTEVAAGNSPALILEDDAWLAGTVAGLLRKLETREGIDHLSLETRNRRKLLSRTAQELAPGVLARRLFLDRSGAAAYVLWPSGAKKLLARSERRPALADAMICQASELNSFQCDPAQAIQLDMAPHYKLEAPLKTQSSLTPTSNGSNGSHGSKALGRSPGQRMRRILAQVHMGLRIVGNSHRARRVFIYPANGF